MVLDTETTGLETSQGHRIIEIGCVELISRRLAGRHYHQSINPQRDVDAGAVEVHGISNDMLAGKPLLDHIAEEFIAFVEGVELVVDSAPFDIGFINHELSLLAGPVKDITRICTVKDSLMLARAKHPGQKNNLDALCKRYGVDNTQRELHGALLDAEILADVYLLMTGGQTDLSLGGEDTKGGTSGIAGSEPRPLPANRPALPIIRANDTELAAHREKLEAISKASGGACLCAD